MWVMVRPYGERIKVRGRLENRKSRMENGSG